MSATSSITKGSRKYKQIMADVATSEGTATSQQSGTQESESTRDLSSVSVRKTSSAKFANIACSISFSVIVKTRIPPSPDHC